MMCLRKVMCMLSAGVWAFWNRFVVHVWREKNKRVDNMDTCRPDHRQSNMLHEEGSTLRYGGKAITITVLNTPVLLLVAVMW